MPEASHALHSPFTTQDLSTIAHERYFHPDPHVQRKMELLWLKHHGETHERIARLAGISRSTVPRYFNAFLHGGLDEIRRCPWHGQRSALEDHRASLNDYFRQHPPRCLGELDTRYKKDMDSFLAHNFRMFDSVPLLAA